MIRLLVFVNLWNFDFWCLKRIHFGSFSAKFRKGSIKWNANKIMCFTINKNGTNIKKRTSRWLRNISNLIIDLHENILNMEKMMIKKKVVSQIFRPNLLFLIYFNLHNLRQKLIIFVKEDKWLKNLLMKEKLLQLLEKFLSLMIMYDHHKK